MDITEKQKQAIRELKEKYFSLVWYARRTYEEVVCYPEPSRTQALEKIREVEKKYPEEAAKLEYSDFPHGFNSGCLACFRLIEGLMDAENEKEKDFQFSIFPTLDT